LLWKNLAFATPVNQSIAINPAFAALQKHTTGALASPSDQSISAFMDRLNINEKTFIDAAVGNFFYRCNIPFIVANAAAWKELLMAMRPAYAVTQTPTAKVLATSMLDQKYDSMFDKGLMMIKRHSMYSIASDGWSNIRSDHIVNFIILVAGLSHFNAIHRPKTLFLQEHLY
jgi:hypothetical protein